MLKSQDLFVELPAFLVSSPILVCASSLGHWSSGKEHTFPRPRQDGRRREGGYLCQVSRDIKGSLKMVGFFLVKITYYSVELDWTFGTWKWTHFPGRLCALKRVIKNQRCSMTDIRVSIVSYENDQRNWRRWVFCRSYGGGILEGSPFSVELGCSTCSKKIPWIIPEKQGLYILYIVLMLIILFGIALAIHLVHITLWGSFPYGRSYPSGGCQRLMLPRICGQASSRARTQWNGRVLGQHQTEDQLMPIGCLWTNDGWNIWNLPWSTVLLCFTGFTCWIKDGPAIL